MFTAAQKSFFANKSYYELMKKTGKAQNTVYRLKNNPGALKIDTLKEILQAYDMTLEQFFSLK